MIQKKDTSIILALLVALAAAPKSLAASAFSPILVTTAPAFPLPSAVPEGTAVRIDGSDSMAVPNKALKQGFEQRFRGTQVEIEAKGTTAALKALMQGQIDIAAIGRALTPGEKAQGLTATPIAREKIAIVVSASNSFTKSLTSEQFAKIFRGEITNWSQVGGLPGQIRLIDRPADSDTRNALRNYPVFKAAPFATGATATQLDADSTARMVQALGQDGIGYAIASQVMQGKVRIVPMHQTLPTDPRYPFSQPRAYVYNQSPSPAVAAVLGYLTSAKGQTIAGAKSGTGSIAPSPIDTTTTGNPAAIGVAAGTSSPMSSPKPNPAISSATVSPANSETPAIATAPTTTAIAPSPNNQVEAESNGGWWWLLPIALLGGLLFWWFSRRSTSDNSNGRPFSDPGAVPEVPPPIEPIPTPAVPIETNAAIGAPVEMSPGDANGVVTPPPPVAASADSTLAARAGSIISSDRAANEYRAPAADALLPEETSPEETLSLEETAAFAEPVPELSAAEIAMVTGADLTGAAASSIESTTVVLEELTPFPIAAIDSDIAAAQTEDPTETVASLDPTRDISLEAIDPVAIVTEVTEITTETVWAGDQPIAEVVEVTTETLVSELPLSAEGSAAFEAAVGESIAESIAATEAGILAAGIGAGAMLIIAADGEDADAPDETNTLSEVPAEAADTLIEPDSRAQSDVTATKFDVGRSITTAALASVDEGLADLPEGYGESRIVLMPRDPQWAYAYWDISNDHKQELRQQGGTRLAVRLYDATDLDITIQRPHSLQQYDCDEMARDWYLPIPVSDRDYIAEIGYVTADERWLMLARSAPVRIPPTYPADWFDEQFVAIDWDNDLRGKTFLELVPPPQESPLAADNAIYDEIFEMAQSTESQRIAGSLFGSMQQVPESGVSSFVLPSGAGQWAAGEMGVPGLGMSGIGMSGIGMSGIGMSGIGASMLPVRARQFWLVADAELIVYGATEPDATITIAGRPIPLNPDGTFRFQLSFQDGKLDYPIVAVAADGEQTRSIRLEFTRETPQRNTNTPDEATDEWFS